MGQRVYDKAEFYVRRGSRKRLRRLLKKHSYLLRSDESFILLHAIWFNRRMVTWLLDCKVHPDCRLGHNGPTPLMQAAADGDVELMHTLLDYGADPNSMNEDRERPLGFACAWIQWPAAELLLNVGADVNAVEDGHSTYLDWAIVGGHSAGIELLRSRGGLRFDELHCESST
jgi:ankyrin repeat protein